MFERDNSQVSVLQIRVDTAYSRSCLVASHDENCVHKYPVSRYPNFADNYVHHKYAVRRCPNLADNSVHLIAKLSLCGGVNNVRDRRRLSSR